MSAQPTKGLPPLDLPAITVGAGKRRPQGRRLALDGAAPLAVQLAEALRRMPPGLAEQWWAPGVFDGDYRAGKRWRGSMLVGVDADYHDGAGEHAAVPPAIAACIEKAARVGELPGSIYHVTPRGLRIVFALARQESDGAVWQSAARGACALVERWLAEARLAASGDPGDPQRDGYTLDVAASCDRARMLWTPRAKVDGVQREAEVIMLREQPYTAEELTACAPARRSPAGSGKPPRANGVAPGSADGAPQGKRHVELLNLGVRLARMGEPPAVISAALKAANGEFAEPKPADEVRRLMEWIEAKHNMLATGITRPKSDVQLARAARAALGDVAAAEGALWRLDGVLWQRVPDPELHRAIVALDGLPVGGDSTINLTSKRILGLVRLATDLDRIDDFFSAAADGIAVGDEWITVGSDGLRREPLRAEHRARWRIEAEPGAIDAEPVQWLALLRDVLADERGAPREGTEEIVTALGETIGLALIGRGATRDARHLLLVGPPNCGKSTLLAIVSSLVPPEGQTALTLHDLAERFRSAALIGVRLVICPEMPSRDLPDIKRANTALTGDPMPVERKRQDLITIRPAAGWFMAANELPAMPDASRAIYRRMIVVELWRQFPISMRDHAAEIIATEHGAIVGWRRAAPALQPTRAPRDGTRPP
ncbi:MAG TPA: DUF5906 domain-containing protein [Polyangia bacterium]|jgi:hypothetical protein|nr:DUF5906 domain-containing protein [Polyangia bacterium]